MLLFHMEEIMSALNSLKFVSAKRPTQLPEIQVRRNKMSNRLWSQIQLATALQKGENYTEKRFRSVRDRQTGETRSVELNKRVRQMWFVGENGKVCLQVKYGSRVLEFSKGKNAIEVNSADELITALTTLKAAVEAGELDSQLNLAADAVKERFRK
jgi:hypothetical protein